MNRLMLRTVATLGAVMALILTSIAPAVAMAGIQGHGSSNLPLGTIQGGSNGPPAEHPGR
jgi:hypothetical protein